MIDKNKIYSIEGECMRNDTIELLLKEDGVYSLIPGDEELSYHNGEVINSWATLHPFLSPLQNTSSLFYIYERVLS